MGSALYLLWLLIAGLLVTGVVRNARRAVGFLAGGAGLLALALRIVPPHIAASPPAYLVGLFAGLAVMSLTLPRTLDRGPEPLSGEQRWHGRWRWVASSCATAGDPRRYPPADPQVPRSCQDSRPKALSKGSDAGSWRKTGTQ